MTSFLPNTDGDLNGIIENHAIEFEHFASSDSQNTHRLFDRDVGTVWCSSNSQWSFFQLNFSHFGVLLTNYTFQVGDWETDYLYPKEWVVSGFDGFSWHNISTITESGMNSPLRAKTFSTPETNIYFSSIKIMQTGRNYYSSINYQLCLVEFDIFGIIGNTGSISIAATNSILLVITCKHPVFLFIQVSFSLSIFVIS